MPAKYTPKKRKLRRKTYRRTEKTLMAAGFPTTKPIKFKKEVKSLYKYRYRKS